MQKTLLLPLLLVGSTGCASMINKKLESTFSDGALLYEAEDIEGIMERVPDDHYRQLPDGRELKGKAAYRTYLEDLFAVSENIDMQVEDVLRDGDTILLVYRWNADVVSASAYTPDMTGYHIDLPAVAVLTIGPKRTIVGVVDYFDFSRLAAPAGYTLRKAAPTAVLPTATAPAPAALPTPTVPTPGALPKPMD